MEDVLSLNEIDTAFKATESNIIQNILRILKGIPKSEDASETGRKKELKKLNAEFRDYIVKYQDVIIEGLSDLLLTSIDKPLSEDRLNELGQNLDKVIKSNHFKKNFAKLKRASEILKSMPLKEYNRFLSEQLKESLENIQGIKNKIHYKENIFIFMSYLTVIENILSNLISEVKSNAAKKHKNDRHIIILISVVMLLSIMLISYFKGKINMEGLDRYLIKIEIYMYKQGLTDYVTFYGIRN